MSYWQSNFLIALNFSLSDVHLYGFLKRWSFLITSQFSASPSLETSSTLQDGLMLLLSSFIAIPTRGLGNCNTGNLNSMERSCRKPAHAVPMLHAAISPGFAQECLSATEGKNSVKSSCLPCRHFSICHPGALLPEPFGQRDPPAPPAQSVSSKLLELLLGASSLGQHRDQHQCRLSSLRGKKMVS